MKKTVFPKGWDQAKIQRVLEHYESQSDGEATAEDEATFKSVTETTMQVPIDLVPAIRKLIAKRRAA